jgi:penicillin-binding protein 2
VGQGYLLVTPLQLAHVAGVLAERGRSFKPRLVKGMHDADGHLKMLPPVEEAPVTGVAAADWDTVLNAMVAVTQHGTGALAFAKAAYTAGGKTGTAQVYTVAQNAKYNAKTVSDKLRDHAWFIAYAPADAPRIAVAVLVENAGFGASNAAPVARKVLDTYLLDQDGKLKAAPPRGETPNTSPKPVPAPDTHRPPQTQTTARSNGPRVSPAS